MGTARGPGTYKELCSVPGALQRPQPYLVWKLLPLEEEWRERAGLSSGRVYF